MEMTQQIQSPHKRRNRCHKLKLMDDYGLKKNKGQFMTCIICRRTYSELKDKVMNAEDTKPKKPYEG